MKDVRFIAVCVDEGLGFKGNISAVLTVDDLDDEAGMRELAADLNQPATTFLLREKPGVYRVRWFAPDAEIGLCGHGSLAAAAYLKERFNEYGVQLNYGGGTIECRADEEYAAITIDAINVREERPVTDVLKDGLGIELLGYFLTDNKHIVLAASAGEVKDMRVDFARLRESEEFGYVVTAKGESGNPDFVSRTLVPHVAQLEDHATGSSHAALTPFWNKRLNKDKMIGHQLSPRGGKFICKMIGDRVELTGKYRTIV